MRVDVLLVFDDFVFDEERYELKRENSPVKIDGKLLDLLAFFLRHPDRLISKQELLDEIWEGRVLADNVLSVSVAKLRKALGQEKGKKEYISTVYGRGYRFVSPVSCIEIKDEKASPKSTTSRGSGRHTPFVGRASVMRRLDSAFEQARAGKGCICVLVGEPGIGKTRVAEEFENKAVALGAMLAWGRCYATQGAPPLWPWTQILHDFGNTGLADEIHSIIDRSITELAPLSHEEDLSNAWVSGTAASTHRAFVGISQTLRKMSAKRPLVMVLDDLQWADASSLRVLDYLVVEISRLRILTIATLRDTELLSQDSRNKHLQYVLGHRNSIRIHIDRLNETDIADYLTTLFSEPRKPDPRLSRAVFDRSEGNPFFVVELLRPWFGSDYHPDPKELELPGLALDVVRQRIHKLDPDTRSVLSAAAVIGRYFDLGILCYVTERNMDPLLNTLDKLLDNDTIVPFSKDPKQFAFSHELIRQVSYEDLTTAERNRLHLRTGEGLERRRASGGEVASVELAHHFLSALPQGEVAKTVNYVRRASAEATRFSAHVDARSLLKRALQALQLTVNPDSYTRCRLLLELSFSERALGDSHYPDHLRQAVGLAREFGYGRLLAAAGRLLSPTPGTVALAGACKVLEAAEDVLPKDDKETRAIVLAHLAWTPPHCMNAERVTELLTHAETLARESQSPKALAIVLRGKLFFSAGPSTQRNALEIAEEIERIPDLRPRLLPFGHTTGIQIFRLVTSMQRGDSEGIQRAVDAFGRTARKLKHAELEWHHARICVVECMNKGDFTNMSNKLAELQENAKRLRLHAGPAICAMDQGVFLRQTTDIRRFAEQVRPQLKIDESENQNFRAWKIRTMADMGLIKDAEAALKRFPVQLLYKLPHDRDYLATLANLALASYNTRTIEHARALYELLKPYPEYYAAGISFHCEGSVSHFLGILARILGHYREAIAHLEDGLERNIEFGLQTVAAHTRYELACVLADTGNNTARSRARSLAKQALKFASKLGMQPLLVEAERLLSELDF